MVQGGEECGEVFFEDKEAVVFEAGSVFFGAGHSKVEAFAGFGDVKEIRSGRSGEF